MVDFTSTFNNFPNATADAKAYDFAPVRLDSAATDAWRNGTDALNNAGSTIAATASKAGIKGVSGSAVGADTPTASNAGAVSTSGSAVGQYLVRGVVIVLGFVFVAVGLSMFKPNMILQKVAS